MSKTCPECGGPATRKGITVAGGSWEGATWSDCLNCDWDSKGGENE